MAHDHRPRQKSARPAAWLVPPTSIPVSGYNEKFLTSACCPAAIKTNCPLYQPLASSFSDVVVAMGQPEPMQELSFNVIPVRRPTEANVLLLRKSGLAKKNLPPLAAPAPSVSFFWRQASCSALTRVFMS